MENNVDLKEVFDDFSKNELSMLSQDDKDAYVAKFMYALLRS